MLEMSQVWEKLYKIKLKLHSHHVLLFILIYKYILKLYIKYYKLWNVSSVTVQGKYLYILKTKISNFFHKSI